MVCAAGAEVEVLGAGTGCAGAGDGAGVGFGVGFGTGVDGITVTGIVVITLWHIIYIKLFPPAVHGVLY